MPLAFKLQVKARGSRTTSLSPGEVCSPPALQSPEDFTQNAELEFTAAELESLCVDSSV